MKKVKRNVKKKDDSKGDKWEGYEELCLGCEGDQCDVWTVMWAPEGWINDDEKKFICAMCAYKEVEVLKANNERLVKEMKALEEKSNAPDNFPELVESVKKIGDKGMKNFASVVSSWGDNDMSEKLIKLQEVEKQLISFKENMRREVKETSADEYRRKRMIVFGLKEDKDKTEVDQVNEIMDHIGIDHRLVRLADVTRMRKNGEDDETVRPVIIEFKDEYDKWKVMREKSKLKNIEGFGNVFLELDKSKAERERDRQRRREKKENAVKPQGEGEVASA